MDSSEILAVVESRTLRRAYLLAASAASAVLLLLFYGMYVMARRFTLGVTRGLHEFVRTIDRDDQQLLSTGSFALEAGTDEVSILKARFLELLSRVNALHRDLQRTEAQRNSLEIDLLQARINPHLLYNSLSVLKWRLLRGDSSRILELLDAVSRYYRIALSEGSREIQVSSEIGMVSNYLSVFNFIEESGHQLILDVPEDLRELYILKHLLQPIVENALMHGLKGQDRDGTVRISCRRETNDLWFTVEDDGKGFDADRGTGLSVRDVGGLGSAGYGLRNIAERIRFYYGEPYGVQVHSTPGRGTAVTLRIRAMADPAEPRRPAIAQDARIEASAR
jgi:sensor histidine kinase YesM